MTLEAQVTELFHQFNFDFTKEKEMADFRKLFIVLAVMAFVAASAFGQPFSCTATTVTQTMRGGGITELAGDINLACSGGTAGTTDTSFVVQIAGGASAITNTIAATATPGQGFLMTRAQLVVSNSANVVQAAFPGFLQTNAATVALFPSVTIPTGTTSFVKITGLRVAAQQVTAVTAVIPVFATVSSTPTNVVSSTNPLLQVGTVYPALIMSTTGTPNQFVQCKDSADQADGFSITFTEQTVTSAFRNKAEEGGYINFVGNVPAGVPANDATTGTRLLAVFTNVPAGVTLSVSNASVAPSTAAAAYVPGADITGTGGSFTTAAPALVEANVTGGVWYATWEVTADNLNTIDDLVFNVLVNFKANPGAGIPGLTSTATPTTLTGSFAPTSTDLLASPTDVIPRFQATNLTASPLFTIMPCITNLLFPYVTNMAGFDTGLAIVNTSADVFGTSTQTGTCTLNFFGTPTVAAFTTPAVDPGTVYAQVLENVGAAGFQGYIIAQCNFQYGHGLAFIVNPGGVGTQYLALVIPNLTSGLRPPDPFPNAGAGTGEQLGE